VEYWKTPLLNDSITSCTQDDWNVVFIDVTVEIHCSKKQVTATVGIMLEQGEQSVYVTAEPLSYTQLTTHCEEIGIDMECTNPDAIAHSLGSALTGLSISGDQRVKVQCSDGTSVTSVQEFVATSSETFLVFPLQYKDLQETGTLRLKTNQLDSFSTKSFVMMMQNFKRIDELEKPTKDAQVVDAAHDPQAAAVLTKSYKTWLDILKQANGTSTHASTVESKTQAEARKDGKENVAFGAEPTTAAKTDDATVPIESTTSAAVSEPLDAKKIAEGNEEPKKPKPKRPRAGFVRVSNPKRKKRRGKLTFAKQGSS
jgi:hypothetical protein